MSVKWPRRKIANNRTCFHSTMPSNERTIPLHGAQNHKLKKYPEFRYFIFSTPVYTPSRADAMICCCLGRTAGALHLRLWWSYILGTRSHNSGNATINAIECAGDTTWNRDFGDTKGVVCTLKCQNMVRGSRKRCYVQIFSTRPPVENPWVKYASAAPMNLTRTSLLRTSTGAGVA